MVYYLNGCMRSAAPSFCQQYHKITSTNKTNVLDRFLALSRTNKNFIRGATLIRGCDAAHFAGYLHIPGN